MSVRERNIGSNGDDGVSIASSNSKVGLKKRVGLVAGISLIVGTMIGSGIFISPKGVTRGSGSVGLSLISWSICGIISMFGALSLAELGTMIPKSGCEYAYLLECYGGKEKYRSIGRIPAFLFNWVSMLLIKPSSIAIISLTCAEYVMVPFFDDGCGEPPTPNKKIMAALVIILLTAVNCFSVKLAARIQVVFTVAKLIAIAVIIIGGIVRLGQGQTAILATGFTGTNKQVGKIAIGIYNGMWAYDGWNNLNYVTEEIINPNVNLPRSILIGIPLVTVCYLLVNISYFTVMTPAQLLDSTAVAIDFLKTFEGEIRYKMVLISLLIAASAFGSINGSMFAAGRLFYVAGREGHMVEVMGMVHVKRNTPIPSLVFVSFIALLMIIPADIESLIDFFNFSAWIFYGLTMSALIVMRFTRKNEPRPYKVPIIIPIIVLIASCYLVVAPIIDDPRMEFLYASIFIVGGLFFYFPLVYFHKIPPFMATVTAYLQLFFEIISPEAEAND
ncbi:DgyrCDS13902 [Dimorphilus gyrociliatus]|uniref:b(0,+)-type amino acid transporter 1 n=1 Tax=Dimorphilus gyrociliatus TaxID=2664684 RepID=A0A7I8WC04_9ANNE|nr:DgyrCDS13902 [Dimorphilus gyrociliatus]